MICHQSGNRRPVNILARWHLGTLVFCGLLAGCGGSTTAPSATVRVVSIAPATGSVAGGTRVVISGQNFDKGSTVSFGEVPVTEVSVESSDTISAVSPPHLSGTVDIVVVSL